MTKPEIDALIEAYVRNSAITAFTDLRLNTILRALLNADYTAEYATATDFQTAVAASPTAPFMAYVADDDIYTFDTDVVLLYLPGRGVGQVAVDFITDQT